MSAAAASPPLSTHSPALVLLGLSRLCLAAAVQVTAVAYDNPIPGFKTRNCINLRLWAAKPSREFDLEAFNTGDYVQVRGETACAGACVRLTHHQHSVHPAIAYSFAAKAGQQQGGPALRTAYIRCDGAKGVQGLLGSGARLTVCKCSCNVFPAMQAILGKQRAETLSSVLYPDDRHYEGKELRLKQQHFFVSATLQVWADHGEGRYVGPFGAHQCWPALLGVACRAQSVVAVYCLPSSST